MRQFKQTKSNKTRRIQPLLNFICETIDCQEIRRLCRYYSLDPLEVFAIDYAGNEVEQPDLQDSLRSGVVRDKNVSRGASMEIVSPYIFSDAVLTDKRMAIFVYPDMIQPSKFTKDTDLIFKVDIVYSIELEKLVDGHLRSWSILDIIADKLDGYEMDNEKYLSLVGAVGFEFEDRIYHSKLANNSGMGIISIPITVYTKGLRSQR